MSRTANTPNTRRPGQVAQVTPATTEAASTLSPDAINPLIGSVADRLEDSTIKVRAVLSLLSSVFHNVEDDGMEITPEMGYGLGLILDTCDAALDYSMREGGTK